MPKPPHTFTIDHPAAFRLDAAREFFAGFTPGSGMAAASVEELTLVFCIDRSFEAVAVSLRDDGGRLIAEMAGSDDEPAVRRQLGRMLGLEADAQAWCDLGVRVAVVGKLQREFPGFFTATKASPYDAAVWAVIAPRLNLKVAARIKIGIAHRHGTAIALRGRTHHVFPGPATLRDIDHVDGLGDEKVRRLRAVAQAAQDGRLDAETLRATGQHEALTQLQSLPGIGPWSAGHIYHRGAAPIDALPTMEPRVLHGLAHALGVPTCNVDMFEHAAQAWRPFRMWVCVLLARHLARAGGWHGPTLASERAVAGRAVRRRASAPAD